MWGRGLLLQGLGRCGSVRWAVQCGTGSRDENQHPLGGMLSAPGGKQWLTRGKNTLCQDLITSFICNHILINAIYTYHSPLLRNVSAPSHCAAWWRGLIIGRKMSPFSSSRMRAFSVPPKPSPRERRVWERGWWLLSKSNFHAGANWGQETFSHKK